MNLSTSHTLVPRKPKSKFLNIGAVLCRYKYTKMCANVKIKTLRFTVFKSPGQELDPVCSNVANLSLEGQIR